MTTQIMVTAAATITIPLLLWIFFSAIRTKWPENYVTASGDFGVIVNRHALRYLAFVFLPAYFVCLLVTTTADRYGGNAIAAAVVGSLIHVARTHVRHSITLARRPTNHTRVPALIVDSCAAFLILAAAILGSRGPGPFVDVVPPASEFFASFWTTVLVALVAVVVINVSRKGISIDSLVERSRREIGPKLLQYADVRAVAEGTDPKLVQAILITENLERPRWIRRLEYLKGKVLPAGTYGVMQVYSATPISDKASIDRAIAGHLSGVSIDTDKWGDYSSSLTKALRTHNTNASFIELATSVFHTLPTASPHREDAHDEANEPRKSKEELIEERVELAAKVWLAMADRLTAEKDGVVAIARTNLDDLRALADILSRVPRPRDRRLEPLKEYAAVVLNIDRSTAQTAESHQRTTGQDSLQHDSGHT